MSNQDIFKGGEKINAFFKDAGKGGVKSVDVGVFESARYPDGTYVAAVAIWNELGTKNIPERPAIRTANIENQKVIISIIKKGMDPKKMVVTSELAGIIGENHKGATQKSIIGLDSPPNAPATIKAKGSTNPLIDTGFYARSITYRVNQ